MSTIRSNGAASLYDYYIQSNQFFSVIERSTDYVKVFKFIGMIGLCEKIYMTILYTGTLINELMGKNDFFDETNNRILFNLFTTIDQLFIFHDWFTFDPFLFSSAFDEIWKTLPFSNATTHKIESQLTYCKLNFTILTLSQFILCYALLFHDPLVEQKKVSNLTYISKVFNVLGYGYSLFIVNHLLITGVFLHSGFVSLSSILDSLVNYSKTKLCLSKQHLRPKIICYYRNVYNFLGQLTDLTDRSHRMFIGTFYLTCVPKMVTMVYDIVFTGAEFKIFHIAEACANVIRLIVITNSVAEIPNYTANFWKTIYSFSIVCTDSPSMNEANLFLEASLNQNYGIKIFSSKVITYAIVPTIITTIATYFIGIASYQRSRIYACFDKANDTKCLVD
uniref:Gustatory receptor n=1 Tax=Tetranychus urticae TaxID=32264 RepID=T1KJS0_TETUR